jgi:uncharacterized membrane protein
MRSTAQRPVAPSNRLSVGSTHLKEKLMRGFAPLLVTLSTFAALLGCDGSNTLAPQNAPDGQAEMAKPSTGVAQVTRLPALKGAHGEALAIDEAGTVAAGFSWDRSGRMHPAKWTMNSGAWALTTLPYPASATSAIARAVNDVGELAGNDFSVSSGSSPLLWSPTGGITVLGCDDQGEVRAISAEAQIAVGQTRDGKAAAWQPGQCREDLPPLVIGGFARAMAINGDGTIIGGGATQEGSQGLVPVRWTRVSGAWHVEQLDSRPGSAGGANSIGDLVGHVTVACAAQDGCSHAFIWYADGSSRELGTLGGEWSVAKDINATREVVGITVSNGTGTPFLWSESLGMIALPVARNHGADARAISDVADGTRLVVGAGGQPFSALLWTVTNP